MKKILLLAALALGALAVSAQSVGGGRSSGDTEVSKGWNTIYLQYNNVGCSHEKINWKDLDWKPSESANGITLGINHAFNIAPTLPLYVEAGLGVQFVMYSDSYNTNSNKLKVTGHLLSAKVPINVLYHFNIPNTDFAIEPLFGFDFRVNILGKAKSEESWRSYYDDEWRTSKDEANLFKKEDMDGNAAKRFQAGWHIGANFVYKQVALGIQYGHDFNKIHDDALNPKLKTTTISLGYRF